MKYIKIPVNFFEDPRVSCFQMSYGPEGIQSLIKLFTLIASFGDEVVFDHEFPPKEIQFDDDAYTGRLCALCGYGKANKRSFCAGLEVHGFVSVHDGKWISSDLTKAITSAD